MSCGMECEGDRGDSLSVEGTELRTLTDLDIGRWRVTTGSGSPHVFDLRTDGTSTVARLPRQVSQISDRDLIADLRRDGDTLPLVGIRNLTVGEDGIFYLRVRTDGVVTLRHTTTVISIKPLEVS